MAIYKKTNVLIPINLGLAQPVYGLAKFAKYFNMIAGILIGSIVAILLSAGFSNRHYYPINRRRDYPIIHHDYPVVHRDYYPSRRRLPVVHDYDYDYEPDYPAPVYSSNFRLGYQNSRMLSTLIFIGLIILGILIFDKRNDNNHLQPIQYPIENMHNGNSSTNF